MISVHLRPVDDDGVAGDAIGSAFLRDGRVIYEGGAGVIESVVTLAAKRSGDGAPAALSRLAVDGWSNGKMVIAAD